MEVVLDMGLDHPRRLLVHYTEHAWLGEEDSVKSEEEQELKQRREERLCREKGLAEAEAEVEAEGKWREMREEMQKVAQVMQGMSIGLERLIRGEGGGGGGGDDGNDGGEGENGGNGEGNEGGGGGGGRGGRGNSGGGGRGNRGGSGGRGSSAEATNDRTWKNGLPSYISKHSSKFDSEKPVTLILFLSEVYDLLEGIRQQNDVEAAKELLVKYADQKVMEAWH